MHTVDNRRGLLLVGHGTHDPSGLAECRTLADKVAGSIGPVPVELAFIELIEPTIAEGIDRIVRTGISQLKVIPLLLFAAGHAKVDVPMAVRDAIRFRSHITADILSPFGLDPRILDLSERRYEEALVDRRTRTPDETYWVMVGRGSSDREATEELGRFALQRAKRSALCSFGWCFVTAARPTLEEGLTAAVASGMKRIVVQPHLLFRGAVLDEIQRSVAQRQAQSSEIEWIMAPHLGAEQEVVNAVLERLGPE